MYNVLIIDDDVDAWFQLNALLRRYTIKASFVNSIGAAKQYLDRQNPALVFVDKQVKDITMSDFVRYVKARYPFAKIIMTNGPTQDSSRYGMKADFVIGKPFIPDLIERAITKMLSLQPHTFHSA